MQIAKELNRHFQSYDTVVLRGLLSLEHVNKIMDETRIMEFNRSLILSFSDDIEVIKNYQEEFLQLLRN